MKRALALIALLAWSGACNSGEDPPEKNTRGLGYEELFADDIDRVLAAIEEAAEPKRFDMMEPLLDLCRTHPSEQVRQSSGQAIENITSQSFGLDDTNERRRTQALGRAMQWWSQHRDELLLGVLVERLRPQLSRNDDYTHSEEANSYLLLGIVLEGLPVSLSAVEWLRIQSKGLESQLVTMLGREEYSPLMKEKMALAIETLPPSTPMDYSDLVARASDPLVRRALYVRWAHHDPESAKTSMRGALETTPSSEIREGLIKTAWSFDRQGAEDHLRDRLRQEDAEAWEIGLAGQMGMDALRPEIIRWGLNRDLDDEESQILREAAKSLGMKATTLLALDMVSEGADRMDSDRVNKVLSLLIGGADEETLIGFLSHDSLREPAARALGALGTKSAVPPLINQVDDPSKSAVALEVLEVITGRDFTRFNPGEFETFLRHEQGDPAVLKPKFIKNRAKLWWSDCADLTRGQWLVMALNEAGFDVIRNDKHAMGDREKILLERLLEANPMEAPGIFGVLMETGQDRNVDFVVRAVTLKRSPSWAEALLPWVDKPLDRNSRKVALAFCAAAGPHHHRQLLALLRSQHVDVMTAAARALERWGGFRAISSLIENVELGSEEQAVLAQEVLSNISGHMGTPILGLTKPQRSAAVKRWRTWWQSVADDTQPGGWQKREVERLLGELGTGLRSQQIWDRLEVITGLPTAGYTKERWQEEWARVSHPQWTLHGKHIVHLSGNNFEHFLLARGKLLADSTRDDVRQMARMAEGAHPAFRATLRRLTGLDPSDSARWGAALSNPAFPTEIHLESEELP